MTFKRVKHTANYNLIDCSYNIYHVSLYCIILTKLHAWKLTCYKDNWLKFVLPMHVSQCFGIPRGYELEKQAVLIGSLIVAASFWVIGSCISLVTRHDCYLQLTVFIFLSSLLEEDNQNNCNPCMHSKFQTLRLHTQIKITLVS